MGDRDCRAVWDICRPMKRVLIVCEPSQYRAKNLDAHHTCTLPLVLIMRVSSYCEHMASACTYICMCGLSS